MEALPVRGRRTITEQGLRVPGSLKFDPSGFGDSRCVFTLAHHKASERRLCHAHRIGPVLHKFVAHIRPSQGARDVFRYFVHYSGRSAGGHPHSIPNWMVEAGTPASEMVGNSGSKDERFLVVTPSARRFPARMSTGASWIGAIM